MAGSKRSTSRCTRADGISRLGQADRYLDVARLVAEDDGYPGVAAALAVLAGIAASDAACCAVLGERHRGPDNRGAVDLVRTIEPGGTEMAKDLARLIQRKDDAHYGLSTMPRGEAQRMVDWAARLVDRARRAVEA